MLFNLFSTSSLSCFKTLLSFVFLPILLLIHYIDKLLPKLTLPNRIFPLLQSVRIKIS